MQSLKGLWLTLALYKASLPHHEVPTVPARSSDSLAWYGQATKGFNASGHSGGVSLSRKSPERVTKKANGSQGLGIFSLGPQAVAEATRAERTPGCLG